MASEAAAAETVMSISCPVLECMNADAGFSVVVLELDVSASASVSLLRLLVFPL